MSYIDDIKKVKNLTVNDKINISTCYVPGPFKQRPWAYRDAMGLTLECNAGIFETEAQCCAHMVAYGSIIYYKLIRALEENEFPYSALNNGVEIYDWGCGQGIGTIAIIEKLRQYGLLSKLKRVTLGTVVEY